VKGSDSFRLSLVKHRRAEVNALGRYPDGHEMRVLGLIGKVPRLAGSDDHDAGAVSKKRQVDKGRIRGNAEVQCLVVARDMEAYSRQQASPDHAGRRPHHSHDRSESRPQ